MESGHISIHAENILPIIKRWLYSEKEIFLRELVSNAADAILKLQKLALIGEVKTELPEAEIQITVDKDKGQIVISDTGLGMTADEIKKYINQVAFSGLHDFLDKYKDKDDSQQVIGHFGLGFYSSFMVAHKVEIDTLSFKEGAEAAHWSCDGSTEFVLSKSDKKTIGTSIILHVGEDSKDMLDEGMLRMLVMRYCAFIRYPVKIAGETVNDPSPLWNKAPSTLSDQDYQEFFRKLFPGSPDPLFWIHLNVDHPFNLKGILYFPKLKHELEASQGEVKLYCNQVYVADNTKELIPEWLTLLKGVVDCPDLPLNVSRSYLQNDPTVRKISEHITKKVADKLSGMAKTDFETYEKFWDDIHPFVKFGMMRDPKFCERMQDHVIFKLSGKDGGHATLAQYQEKMKGKVEDGTVLYCSDPKAQVAYLRMLDEHGMQAAIAETMIDQHFIPYFEMQTGRKWKFKRVDSDLSEHLVEAKGPDIVIDGATAKTATETIDKIFRDHLEHTKVKIRVEGLKSDKVPAMLIQEENARRFKDMAKSNPSMSMFAAGAPDERTLVVNQNSPAIKNLLNLAKSFNREDEIKLVVNQIYDLAWLQQGEFSAEMMQSFIDRSAAILGRLGSPGAATTVDASNG